MPNKRGSQERIPIKYVPGIEIKLSRSLGDTQKKIIKNGKIDLENRCVYEIAEPSQEDNNGIYVYKRDISHIEYFKVLKIYPFEHYAEIEVRDNGRGRRTNRGRGRKN